jgi:hypothetical protein
VNQTLSRARQSLARRQNLEIRGKVRFDKLVKMFCLLRPCLILAAVCVAADERVDGQSSTFAGNAQHTGLYDTPAQPLNTVHWSAVIDPYSSGTGAHYGAPIVTASNTVITGVATTNGVQLSAFEGASGRLKYTLPTDYVFAGAIWRIVYQPVIAPGPSGPRLYFPGAGGTVYYIDNIDSDTPSTPVQECFYTSLATYQSNALTFATNVFINTPITADTNGTIFFGFVPQGTPPAPLNTNSGGFVRIDSTGNASYVLTTAASADNNNKKPAYSSAPALSADGTVVYVVAGPYLLGLNSTTLATQYRASLRDPRSTSVNAIVSSMSTASPLVGPDGDVFIGVLASPDNASRGFLLHFSADLQTRKLPGGFGWDNTPAIVPTNMVPSYTGPSSYLLFSKYNNYFQADGNGINKIAILDPNVAQIDPHSSASGLAEMREVLVAIGCTTDGTFPRVREWCINAAAVNPATKSVYAPSEDGRLYRWDLSLNSLSEAINLPLAIGEPYVPATIGPDGTIFTLNAAKMFAIGGLTNFNVGVYSSSPDLRSFIAGQPVTFTAVVTNLDPVGAVPTGTISFQGVTTRNTSTIVTNLGSFSLTNGVAALTATNLNQGDGTYLITATYSGDSVFPSGKATLAQKVHTSVTTTSLSASISNNVLKITGTVTALPTNAPTGMLCLWNGSNVLIQKVGMASVSITNPVGIYNISAIYASDTLCAASAATLPGIPPHITASFSSNGAVQLDFTNFTEGPYTVLGADDVSLPSSNWSVLGTAIESSPGQFHFTDDHATNYLQRFYRVRSP